MFCKLLGNVNALFDITIKLKLNFWSDNNAEFFRLGLGYELENISVDGLVLELVYGELSNDKGTIFETDIIASYEISDKLYLEATYTNYKSTCNNNNFDRTLVRLDYGF